MGLVHALVPLLGSPDSSSSLVNVGQPFAQGPRNPFTVRKQNYSQIYVESELEGGSGNRGDRQTERERQRDKQRETGRERGRQTADIEKREIHREKDRG